jgi:peptide/nickel transport system permease protein
MTALARLWDHDLAHAFRHDPLAILSAIVVAAFLIAALLAPMIIAKDPFDLRNLDLIESLLPPGPGRLLGTDDQGRDLLAAIVYGTRLSLVVAVLSVVVSLALGVTLGLIAGFAGGFVDAFIMRAADIQLSFPAILVALLVDGIARAALPGDMHARFAVPVLIAAIALSGWVQYARTVRGLTLAERSKDYVQSARVSGVAPARIARAHILPNVTSPLFVLATVQIATAILTEATLSFLGVGMPPTSPSLGTLVNIGNNYLFSGAWWISVFPGLALVMLVLAVNLLGDWLRDVLNPRLG